MIYVDGVEVIAEPGPVADQQIQQNRGIKAPAQSDADPVAGLDVLQQKGADRTGRISAAAAP
ncbi:MAG TPA: hypothetical protein VN279_02095 [Rhodocyclaceae bacterium]|nr:hypothetical protein [Rhodocyclaceae bacterium]